MEFKHIPVLLEECLEGLAVKPDGIYVDCTLGGGGHSRAIAARLGPDGVLVGIDQDREALSSAASLIEGANFRLELVHANFRDLEQILQQLGIEAADGFLFDLGVSSYQLDNEGRGFSYQEEAPLDMRMDSSQGTTAQELVNTLREEELARILWEYGEERWSRRIAQFIVNHRQRKPVITTSQLVGIIKEAIPAAARREGPHPARRSFQALRIAVNDELGSLGTALYQAAGRLRQEGRLCVVSFHSLEDRTVKEIFRDMASGCQCPPALPVCVCNREKILRPINKKPIVPSPAERERNPRSRSAKLRIGERTAP